MRSVLLFVAVLLTINRIHSLPFNSSTPIDHCTSIDKGLRTCGDLNEKCVESTQFCDGIADCPNEFDEVGIIFKYYKYCLI